MSKRRVSVLQDARQTGFGWNGNPDYKRRIVEMEAVTRAVWDFMHSAYNKGVLDEILAIAGQFLDPEMDLGEQLGNFEDALTGANFTAFENFSRGGMVPVLQALSQDDAMEGLSTFISAAKSLVEAGQRKDGDVKEHLKVVAMIGKGLLALKPVVLAVLPVIAKVYGPAVVGLVDKHLGGKAAGAINSACAAINTNPRITSHVLSDLFAGVDGETFRRAMDTIVGTFLDQRPPLAGWTAATVVRRARKRLEEKRRPRHVRD